jgi:hypothetical protein
VNTHIQARATKGFQSAGTAPEAGKSEGSVAKGEDSDAGCVAAGTGLVAGLKGLPCDGGAFDALLGGNGGGSSSERLALVAGTTDAGFFAAFGGNGGGSSALGSLFFCNSLMMDFLTRDERVEGTLRKRIYLSLTNVENPPSPEEYVHP